MDPRLELIIMMTSLSLFFISLKADTISTSSSTSDDYERTIQHEYQGSAPFMMIYRQNDVIVFIGNTTRLIQNFGPMKPASEPIRRMSPIVDKAGNIVYNDNRRTFYSQHSTGRTFPVFTNVSHTTYQTAHDPRSNRVFIISRYSLSVCASLRRVSRTLFAFNSMHPNIIRGKVMTKEVRQLGRNLTAISIDPDTGKMVIADEVYKSKKWNLTLLEPVSSLKIRNIK